MIRVMTIKGPGLRLNLDVRRLWECPKCGRQRKLSGDVVSQFCRCGGESGGDGAWMRLLEAKRTVRADRPRVVHELACEEIAANEASAEPATGPQSVAGNGRPAAESDAAPTSPQAAEGESAEPDGEA